MSSLARRVAWHVATLRWDALSPAVQRRASMALLDVLGCGLVGVRLGAHARLTHEMVRAGGRPEATVWGAPARLPAAHAALVNGTVAHHVEMDDGNPRASLHGGVTIVPAALALGERLGASGREVLSAIVGGYNGAVACGRPLRAGIAAHGLHEPSMVGCFGAALAAARLLGLAPDAIEGALALAATQLPMGPFEAFTKGSSVKDLYGGWPAFTGIMAASMAERGLWGPSRVFEAPRDGIGRFLTHAAIEDGPEADAEEMLHVQFKAYATCRSVQPALTALETLLPVDPERIVSVIVETYPFAVALSHESDARTSIGAKTSIPFSLASYVLTGSVGPEAFSPEAVLDERRHALARLVTVRVAEEMVDPLVRGARVEIRLAGGETRRGATEQTRWTEANPATEAELRRKFRRLAGRAAPSLEGEVDRLAEAPDLSGLTAALGVSP